MKKIIALMLVLLLMLTMFVACKKDEEPDESAPSTPSTEDTGNDPTEEEELYWDKVGKVERPNQHDATGTELPRVPIQ